MSKDLTGATLGKYQIVERLGRGGMADVYRAYQPGMDRYVAIKIMHGHLADDPNFITRFKREAQGVGTLRHPNIVQVIDFDLQDEEYYMVMEYIQGDTLKSLIKERGSLPMGEALGLTIKLADAVAYAHSRGMIHRDIKPANVLMTGPDNPVLTDFGIAHIMDASGLTSSGMAIGTPAYISPEAGRGDKVDERADIYSLGIVLFEMLTGTVPYDADTPYAVILKHINDPLPAPRSVMPDLPESIERIILKALAKNREDRYQSAADFRDAMIDARAHLSAESAESAPAPRAKRISAAPSPVAATPTVVEMPPSRRNTPVLVGGLVIVIVAVAVIAGIVALSNRPGTTPLPTAVPATRVAAAPAETRVTPTRIATVAFTTVATVAAAVPTTTAAPTTTVLTAPVTVQATVQAAMVGSAVGNSPTNRYASLTEQVKQMIIQSDFDRALSMLEGALAVDPQSYDLLVLYGRACIESGTDRRDKGKTSADTAQKLAPDRPEAYIVIAQYYLTANMDKAEDAVANLRQAAKYLTQAVEHHSDDYYAYWLRAHANQTLNDYIGSDTPIPIDQIIGDYEKAASFSPPDYRFYVERGDFYFDGRQDYAAAQASYERAVSLNQDDADVLARLAKAYLITDQKPKAYDLAARFIQRNSTPDARQLANCAYLAWADGQTEQARTWATRALSMDNTTATASYVLALLAWDAKQYDTALARLDDVLKTSDPSNYTYPFLNQQFDRGLNMDRARIYTAMERFDDALIAYNTAMNDTGDTWSRPYVERARLYIRLGRLDEANQDLQKALTLAATYEHGDKTANEVRELLKQIGSAATPVSQQ